MLFEQGHAALNRFNVSHEAVSDRMFSPARYGSPGGSDDRSGIQRSALRSARDPESPCCGCTRRDPSSGPPAGLAYLRVSTRIFAIAPDSTRSWAFAISDKGKTST